MGFDLGGIGGAVAGWGSSMLFWAVIALIMAFIFMLTNVWVI